MEHGDREHEAWCPSACLQALFSSLFSRNNLFGQDLDTGAWYVVYVHCLLMEVGRYGRIPLVLLSGAGRNDDKQQHVFLYRDLAVVRSTDFLRWSSTLNPTLQYITCFMLR